MSRLFDTAAARSATVACTRPNGKSRPMNTTSISPATAEVPFVDLRRHNLAIGG